MQPQRKGVKGVIRDRAEAASLNRTRLVLDLGSALPAHVINVWVLDYWGWTRWDRRVVVKVRALSDDYSAYYALITFALIHHHQLLPYIAHLEGRSTSRVVRGLLESSRRSFSRGPSRFARHQCPVSCASLPFFFLE
jgi:hypothetical protein